MPVDSTFLPAEERSYQPQTVATTTYCLCGGMQFGLHKATCIRSPFYQQPKPSLYAGKRAWKTYEVKYGKP